MKRNRKIITWLCITTLLISLSGCGSDKLNKDSQSDQTNASANKENDTKGTIEIEFVQGKREAGETYDKVIAAFESKNPGIKINQSMVPDVDQILMTRASSDNLPDLFLHWPSKGQFIQFSEEGLLLDLSDKEYMNNIESQYINSVKTEQGIYIVPYCLNFMGLYYNEDKFEEAGFQPPKTWDELIDLAKKIEDIGETPFVLPGKDGWVVSQLFGNIESKDLGDHTEIYKKMNKGEEDFTTIPEYKESLEKMVQLMNYADKDSLALGYEQGVNDFATGKAWMFPQGSWALPALLNSNPDLKVSMVMMPNNEGDMKAIVTPDTGLCVNAKVADNPKKMAAIDKFLAFCTSKEGAQIYTENDKSPSCVKNITYDVPQFKKFFEYVDKHGSEPDAYPMPVGFQDTMGSMLQRVLLGDNIDDFLKELSAEYKESLRD